MIEFRYANERGHANHGWLDTWHTFSFAEYHDPEQMGYSVLRVINDDLVQPRGGFGTHGHRDMEIVTYVLDGLLEHKDSMGNGSLIRPGDVQRMSAGTGVQHSEYNPSSSEIVHLLQIWILPARTGIKPEYEQKTYPADEKRGQLRLIASHDGADGSVVVHQDVLIYAALVNGSESVQYDFKHGRPGYLHVARGSLSFNGQPLNAGDGVKLKNETRLLLEGGNKAEVLLFDLP